jgi:hypothetical protein
MATAMTLEQGKPIEQARLEAELQRPPRFERRSIWSAVRGTCWQRRCITAAKMFVIGKYCAERGRLT